MRVALLGAGTVGQGVLEILRKRGNALEQKGTELKIVKVCVKDASKPRDFEFPEGAEVVTDPSELFDDNIEMIVELMGGITVAKEVVMKALAKGKHVITGNKALIASHLPAIQAALKANPKASFSFEAAVCGGIPIIQLSQLAYVGDKIKSIMGIMNGTTNYMLTQMAGSRRSYDDALAEATRLGYAETPPDYDVKGYDARSKLAILCKLFYGTYIPEESIPCTGITQVSTDDFAYAAYMSCTIKLLGVAKQNDDGSVTAYVSVCMVSLENQLASVSGVRNCILVDSENLGSCMYSGKGAGRFPTANSVINDMVAVANGTRAPDPFPRNSEANFSADITAIFYIRFMIKDGLGIIEKLGRYARENGVSINAIYQTPIQDQNRVPFAVVTDECEWTAVNKLAKAFHAEDFSLEEPLVMPLIKETL